MTDPATDRRIELEVEVPGDPEEVWAAVATGPGISSWFIPMDVDERAGGLATMHWGEGFGDATADVVVWDPPRRVVFRGQEEQPLAYEWLVEARDGGSCVVRLVNSGFGEGDEWDEQYHGMAEGWRIFMENLRLQLTHFRGHPASRTIIPTVMLPGPRDAAWTRFCTELGLPADAQVGDRLTTADGAPPLAGRVESVLAGPASQAYLLVLEEPCPGTAFVAVECGDQQAAASAYLYLRERPDQPVDAGLEATWRTWLATHFPTPEPAPAPS